MGNHRSDLCANWRRELRSFELSIGEIGGVLFLGLIGLVVVVVVVFMIASIIHGNF